MFDLFLGEEEHREAVKDVIEEPPVLKEILDATASTGIDLYRKTGDAAFLFMPMTMFLRIGIWIERNMPEKTKQELGEGVTLEELKEGGGDLITESIIKSILKDSGRHN